MLRFWAEIYARTVLVNGQITTCTEQVTQIPLLP